MKILFVAVMVVGGFVILVLALNIFDRDAFDGGSLTTPAGPAPDPIAAGLLPETVSHSCPTCGECVHPVEILESLRTITLVNHRPWYKFLRTGDETLYYEDTVFLAACMQNRAAREPKGDWTIVARLGPARHGAAGPHECGKVHWDSGIIYELTVSEAPPVGARNVLAYSYASPRLPPILHFGWRVRGTISGDFPCPCGKP